MRHPSLAFTLLSMFTTTEKASEIEGDLIEQSHIHGKSWMRRQVPLVVLALFGQAISRSCASIVLLSVPAFAAIFSSVMLSEWLYRGPIGPYLTEQLAFSLTAAKLAVLALTVFPATYLIGAVLVLAAPALGTRVAAATAVVFSVFVTGMHLYLDSPSLIVVAKLAVEFGLVTVPLLCGSIWSHRRALRRMTLNRESQT
jgi:hypothetical protein